MIPWYKNKFLCSEARPSPNVVYVTMLMSLLSLPPTSAPLLVLKVLIHLDVSVGRRDPVVHPFAEVLVLFLNLLGAHVLCPRWVMHHFLQELAFAMHAEGLGELFPPLALLLCPGRPVVDEVLRGPRAPDHLGALKADAGRQILAV